MKLDLIAPCGLDCFNCDYYIDNIPRDWIPQISEVKGLEPDNVPCKGCIIEKGCKYHDYKCETLDCINNKGLRFCFECDDFPCSKLQPASDGANKFPHNFKLYNLCRMKKIGIEKWIQEAKDIRTKYFKGRFIVGTGPVLDTDKLKATSKNSISPFSSWEKAGVEVVKKAIFRGCLK